MCDDSFAATQFVAPMAEPAPEMIEKFRAGRAALRANPILLGFLIGKLSSAAQGPAKQFRDLLLSEEQDLTKLHVASFAMKIGLSEEVKRELEMHKREIARLMGLTISSV